MLIFSHWLASISKLQILLIIFTLNRFISIHSTFLSSFACVLLTIVINKSNFISDCIHFVCSLNIEPFIVVCLLFLFYYTFKLTKKKIHRCVYIVPIVFSANFMKYGEQQPYEPYDDDPIICAIFSSYGVACFHIHPNFSYARYIICGILLLIYNTKNSWEIYCVILLWLQWCSQFIWFDVCSILAIFIRISVSFFFVSWWITVFWFSLFFLYAFSVSSIPYFISTMNVTYCFQFQWADTFVFSYISCLSIKSIHI